MIGTLPPGTTFAGRYEILELLGRGGMGNVYRALHTGLRKDVALKVLGPTPVNDSQARFEREARAIAKLDHPSCVRIFDYGRTKRNQYIAMELLDGPTLCASLRTDGRFSSAKAARIARGLLGALVHAHGRGVLHRDIKPENVMFAGPAGRAVLIDFGLAQLRDDAPLTAQGMCIGSPSYIAPERLDGRAHDARGDLYAIGVILYEMLAGVRPFTGASTEEILRNCRERPPRPLRAIRSDVSKPLDAVVVRALAKDPARRFADAQAMLDALEDVPVLEDLAVRAAVAEREEEETTSLFPTELALEKPSVWTRIWGRLRFGRWRWSV
jgi:eukaryotic-like serine/threonine-protein kinase